MTGEKDLNRLLKDMSPVMDREEYVFVPKVDAEKVLLLLKEFGKSKLTL